MKSKTESRTENETEKEKVEGLMKPRFKIIADWPDMLERYSIGDIIPYDCVYVTQECSPLLTDYPHLFKKLEWFKDRKEIEMPIYLKSKYYDLCQKVDRYIDSKFFTAKDHWMYYYLYDFLPATKEEYEAYINKNK